jgi:hypothetical protein
MYYYPININNFKITIKDILSYRSRKINETYNYLFSNTSNIFKENDINDIEYDNIHCGIIYYSYHFGNILTNKYFSINNDSVKYSKLEDLYIEFKNSNDKSYMSQYDIEAIVYTAYDIYHHYVLTK